MAVACQLLSYGVIVDGLFDAIADGGRGKIEVHIHRKKESLWFRAFLVRNTDTIKHFKVDDRYPGHGPRRH
jgi:hypothetical protein